MILIVIVFFDFSFLPRLFSNFKTYSNILFGGVCVSTRESNGKWFLYYKLVFALFGRSGGGRITLGNTSPVTSQLERKRTVRFFFPRRHSNRQLYTMVVCVCMARAVKSLRARVYIYVYRVWCMASWPALRSTIRACVRVCVCRN